MEGVKWVLGGMAFAAAAAISLKRLRYLSFRKTLTVEVIPVPTKVTGTQAEIGLIITVKNPTLIPCTIKEPEVKLLAFNREFARSEKGNREYRIEGKKQLRLLPVIVKVNYLDLLTTFPDLVADLRNRGKVIVDSVVEIKTEGFLAPVVRKTPLKIDLSGKKI